MRTGDWRGQGNKEQEGRQKWKGKEGKDLGNKGKVNEGPK